MSFQYMDGYVSSSIQNDGGPFDVMVDLWILRIVKLLMGKGADPNEELPDGSTPFTVSVRSVSSKKHEMIDLLIRGGADVNRCSTKDGTVLHASPLN